MHLLSRSLWLVFPFLLLLSCKSEPTFQLDRKKIVDSTILAFQRDFYKEKIDSLLQAEQFSGIISLKQNDSLLYENARGYADFEKRIAFDSNSVFPIASNSKQFTAVLVLLQQEAGHLKLSDKAAQFLPEFKAKNLSEITIQQLLNHTSGLNDFGDRLKDLPGKAYHYSNKGYTVLGKIVETAAGHSFDQVINQLFTQAQMRHSSTASQPAPLSLVHVYVGNEAQQKAVEGMPQRLATKNIGVAAGGVLATANDLHLWHKALYDGELLSDSSLKKFMAQSAVRDHYLFDKVGYGDGIMMNQSLPRAYFHTGYVKGAPSLLVYYPATKTSVVILSNRANEALGKQAFFKTHKIIKQWCDRLEKRIGLTRKLMLRDTHLPLHSQGLN